MTRWRPHLAAVLPQREIRFWPEIGDKSAIDCALVWHPEPGLLASLPNLKLIVSLGAGVDHILRDPDLPGGVPILRLVDPYMTDAMSEYIVLQVLRLHRQDIDYRTQQSAAEWREREQKNAAERTVGILGFGTLGQDAGKKLKALGFDVAGWGRSAKDIPGFATYAGPVGLDALLARSEILVSLLPMTPETDGILDAARTARRRGCRRSPASSARATRGFRCAPAARRAPPGRHRSRSRECPSPSGPSRRHRS